MVLLLIGLAAMYWVFAYDLVRSDFVRLISLMIGSFVLTHRLIKIFGGDFKTLAISGLLLRAIFLLAIPNLSQDFYRFLWDGRLIVQGMSPYLQTPVALLQAGNHVVPQAQILVDGMGDLNAGNFSNYPPLNQLCFAIAALFAGKSILGSVVVLRLLIITADLGILLVGKRLLKAMGLPVRNIFWYFLNPFIIVELTGNLHFEGVMLFFLVTSLLALHRGRWLIAAVLLGLSISVKLIPLMFLPIFYHYFVKKGLFSPGFWKLKGFFWLTLATVLLTFLPFISQEFLSNFSQTIGLWFQKFEFNASVYYLVRWVGFQTVGWNIIATAGKILPLIVITFVLIMSFLRKINSTVLLINSMMWCVSFYLLLSTTVHPWYIATPLLLSIFTPYRFAVWWSLLVMLSYSAYGPDGFHENLWLVALEYVLGIVFVALEIRNRKKRPLTNHLAL
jgi:hypothetical protein